MRILVALILSIAASFIITPIGGLILFLVIVFTGKKLKPVPQTVTASVIVNNKQEANRPDFNHEIDKLFMLKERGVITQEEFEERKTQLLNNH